MNPKSLPSTPATVSSATSPAKKVAAPVPERKIPRSDHELIAQRARAIWQAKGCPAGHDEENWLEAEAQLSNELAAV